MWGLVDRLRPTVEEVEAGRSEAGKKAKSYSLHADSRHGWEAPE